MGGRASAGTATGLTNSPNHRVMGSGKMGEWAEGSLRGKKKFLNGNHGWRRLAVGGWQRLVVVGGGWWRLAVDGGWWSLGAVPKGGP